LRATFPKSRLEAFTDGVLAIVITIMVLEMKVPQHAERFADLAPIVPVFLSYALSFVYIGIYWSNHHHLFHAAQRVTGGVLWANLAMLFCLSLIPFASGWMDENHFAPAPVALYGIVLLLSGLAYRVLQARLVRIHGRGSVLASAVGRDLKTHASLALYLAAIALAFVAPWAAGILYVAVALIWLVPDRRIERALTSSHTPAEPPEAGL
jgi:uncharacterized membrane protein